MEVNKNEEVRKDPRNSYGTRLVFSFAACGGKDDGNKDSSTSAPAADVTKSASELTVGFIFLHDENSTYDLNFINAAEAACKATGAKIIKKTNVPENSACYEAAADLVDSGCDIVFADSFGHEDFIIQAAKEFPNVQFCHATGTKLTPRILLTTTTHLLPFIRAVTLQVSQQA